MAPRITVCGLGPGGSDRITEATRAAIADASRCYLRTRHHPNASVAADAQTFDHLYDTADSFAEVYSGIVDSLVDVAGRSDPGSVVYVVPGSPLVLENSVRRLLADDRVEVELLPALSFLDEAWTRLRIDPVEESVRLIDGHQFSLQAAGERGPLLVAHVHAPWVLSDIKLSIDAGDEQRAVVLQRLGTSDERIFEVAWSDLDRIVEADHLTSLYLPEVTAPVGRELIRTVELMHRLRLECPWDQAQDHESLRTYLIEESYEVLDALDRLSSAGTGGGALAGGDGYAELEEELGDLWFQILFHAELATEAGQFSIADVARTLYEKMVGRHPHVFGGEADDGQAPAATTEATWDTIKREEKQRDSALDGVPTGLPALALASKVLHRAERAGFAVDPGSIARALDEPIPDDLDSEGFGRLLLAIVGFAASRGVDPEDALRRSMLAATDRFRRGELSPDGPTVDWALG